MIIEPDGDVDDRGRRRSRSPGSATPGSRASRPSASTCTRPSPTRSSTSSCRQVEALVVGDPLDEATDVSALISTGERDRVEAWIDEAVAAGAKVATGGVERNGVLAPDGAHRRARPT